MQNPISLIFPTLFDKLSEGIVYQTLNGEIVYANPSASSILGLTPEKLLGLSSIAPRWHAIREDYSDFPGEEHPAMVTLKTGEIQKDVIMGVKKGDGNTCWLQINSHPIFDKEGKIEAAVTSFADITQQIEAVENLRLSEQSQKAILSSIREGFYLVDKDLKIIVINKAAIELHQLAFKKYCTAGDYILDLFPEERLHIIKTSFTKAFAGEKTEYEVKYTTGSGDLWLHVTYNPVKEKDDVINLVCIGISDVTKRKQTEKKLLDSEIRFREALSNLGDNVWEHNFKTGETYFSEWINGLVAYNDQETGNNVNVWWNSTHPEDKWMLEENDRRYKEGLMDNHSLEYRIIQKDGSLKWVLDRGVVIEKDTDGKPVKIIGTHTDITERKQIEEEIKANEAKFRAIFNSTFQFMGLMTVDGILLEANQTATDFFRIPKEEVMGMNFIDSRWFSPATREKSKQALAKAANGETVNYELELDLLDGRKVVLDFSIRPIFDAQGNVILLIPEGRDITEKLRMEKEIERERKNKQKEILTASIEGQEKQRREVARELHDNINQVLATVKIYLQLAGENESLRESLIHKSYENISHAIEEVRNLSKSLAPPTLDDTTLAEALQEMVNDMVLSRLFEIKFNEESFEEDLLDNSQKMTIYRVAQEQFTNILKYAKAKKIAITLSTSSNAVSLIIEDDGIGFDTTERLKGTGIKNMMSRIEAHNGKFNLVSLPGQGCRLQIILPLIKALNYEEN